MRFGDKATLSIAEAVQAVIAGLKDADLDESRMSEFHAMMKDGKSAADIAKALKLDVKTVKTLMSEDTQPTELEAVTEALLDFNEDFNATQDAKKHAKKDRQNYDRDVSVQHRYDAYHYKKKGYTHFVTNRSGGRTYNKNGNGTEIGPEHHKGVSEDTIVEAKVKKLSSKEEAAVLKLISKTKTTKEAAAKVAKEMKISDKEASAVVKMVMSQYESVEVPVEVALEAKSDKQAKYQAFFKKAMKKFGIDDIADLKGDKKKEFFDYVDANYEAEGEVDEVAEPEAEGEKKFKALHKVKVSEETVEVDESAKENWIDGVKYQKLKKMKGFNKADWEWNSSKQLYKKVKEDVQEAVELDEAFLRLPGEMINGELPMAIRDLESILKGLKAGNDFDAKGFNKQMARLTAVKKAAKKFNSEKEVPTRYQYTKKESVSLDAEGIQLDEAFNIEKGTNVKMKAGNDKDLYGTVIKQVKVNGKPGVTVQWKNGVKGNFRMDQFASVSMDRKADYQVNDDGVRFSEAAIYEESMTASIELLEARPSTVIVVKFPIELFNKAGQTFRATAPEKYKTTVVAASNDRYFAIAGEPKNLEKMLKTDPILKGKVDVEATMATAVKFTGKEKFGRQKGKNFTN